MYVQVKIGAEFSIDHRPIVCSLRISKPVPSRKFRKSSATCTITWEALQDKQVKKQFASSMSAKFRKLLDESENIEKEWSLFRSAIIASSVECCDSWAKAWLRVAGDSEKRTPSWWNQDVREAIRAKKEAFKALLQNRP